LVNLSIAKTLNPQRPIYQSMAIPEIPKKSKILDINQKAIVIIITWILTIFGAGVGGFITIWDFLHRGENFYYSDRGVGIVPGKLNEPVYTTFIFLADIKNTGNEPLTIRSFKIKLIDDSGQDYFPDPVLIPEDSIVLDGGAMGKRIFRRLDSTNLIHVTKIIQKDSYRGLFLYRLPYMKTSYVRDYIHKFQITCTTIEGKKYIQIIPFNAARGDAIIVDKRDGNYMEDIPANYLIKFKVHISSPIYWQASLHQNLTT
jgi:hypothetical protein